MCGPELQPRWRSFVGPAIGLVVALGTVSGQAVSAAMAGAERLSTLPLTWAQRSPMQGATRLIVTKMESEGPTLLVLAYRQFRPHFQLNVGAERGGFGFFQRLENTLAKRLAHRGWLLDIADANQDGRMEVYYTQSNELRQARLVNGRLVSVTLRWQGYEFALPPRQLLYVSSLPSVPASGNQNGTLSPYFHQHLIPNLLRLDARGVFHTSEHSLRNEGLPSFASHVEVMRVRFAGTDHAYVAIRQAAAAESVSRLQLYAWSSSGLRWLHRSSEFYGPGLAAIDVEGNGRQELLVSRQGVLHRLAWDAKRGLLRNKGSYRISPENRSWRLVTFAVGDVDADGSPEVISLWADENGTHWLRCHPFRDRKLP